MNLEEMQNNNSKKVIIVANGDIDKKYLQKIFNSYEFKISADGAGDKLYEMNLMPDIMVGDFDSINPCVLEHYKNLNVEFMKLDTHKDYTDTHICIQAAIDKGYKEIDIIGAIGGRWDHSLANVNLLYFAHKKDIRLRLVSENNTMEIFGEGEYSLEREEDCYCSLIAIFDDSLINLEDMKYSPENLVMRRGESIGVSNEYLEKDGRLTVKKGSVMLIKSKKD